MNQTKSAALSYPITVAPTNPPLVKLSLGVAAAAALVGRQYFKGTTLEQDYRDNLNTIRDRYASLGDHVAFELRLQDTYRCNTDLADRHSTVDWRGVRDNLAQNGLLDENDKLRPFNVEYEFLKRNTWDMVKSGQLKGAINAVKASYEYKI